MDPTPQKTNVIVPSYLIPNPLGMNFKGDPIQKKCCGGSPNSMPDPGILNQGKSVGSNLEYTSIQTLSKHETRQVRKGGGMGVPPPRTLSSNGGITFFNPGADSPLVYLCVCLHVSVCHK